MGFNFLKNRLLWKYREITASYRTLPNFIIIGAQKSGTNSLHYYLNQHPELFSSYEQEIHYFAKTYIDNFSKGESWYRKHFALKKKVGKGKVFETSPGYIDSKLAPKRIYECIPKVKLIAILRNPTERAISNYFHEKRRGTETLSIHEAMYSEENRLATFREQVNKNVEEPFYEDYAYKKRGIYVNQIKNYLEYFTNEQLYVVNSEYLFTNPSKVLREVFTFLEVDTTFIVQNVSPQNVNPIKTKVDSSIYEYLDNYFDPYNQLLYDLLGRDFGW